MYSGTLIEFLNMGGGEIMLILGVVLLLFGGKKLPELARGHGKGLRDFKDASEGVKRELHRNINAVGITDEINDFKSTINDADNSRHHPYEYQPEDNTHNNDTDGKPAIDFNKAEPAGNNENTTTETDKTKI
jgi:sec-independent protein translocase protein TatA